MYSDDLIRYARMDITAPGDDPVQAQNTSCGDTVRLTVDPPGLEVDGCLVCTAAAKKALEAVQGDEADELRAMDENDFLDFLDWDLSPQREDCALTVLRALRKALQ
ncbi:MAG: hypothetical protein SV186_00415 [Candidatus Nanohaloarchaea archaeon]|nr:hypothetical protein [Candidatus Nanohaloarchaea archaeon]